MMSTAKLIDKLYAVEGLSVPVTVHTGGDSWEQIVDVVYCQECKQYHIISERLPDGHVDPLKGNYY